MMKRKNLLVLYTSLITLVTGCGGYPSIISLPYDYRGTSINSAAIESFPQIAPPFIVFVSDRNGMQSVYLYNSQNKRLVDLPGLNFIDAIASSPTITEDGRYIAFVANRNGRSSIYFYDRQTKQRRNLTENVEAEVRNPSISSNGKQLAYEIARNGHWEIEIINPL
jgi:Tol biopolymer transport system component